jgi:ubiquitin-like protein Pup
MAEQKHVKKSTTEHSDEVVEDLPASSRKGEELKDELDGLLDEIDEVLDTNAEEFVKSYVQKGGE